MNARIALALSLLTPARALADHGGGGDVGSGMGAIGVALFWGGTTFVVGMLIVAVIARLTRRDDRDS